MGTYSCRAAKLGAPIPLAVFSFKLEGLDISQHGEALQ